MHLLTVLLFLEAAHSTVTIMELIRRNFAQRLMEFFLKCAASLQAPSVLTEPARTIPEATEFSFWDPPNLDLTIAPLPTALAQRSTDVLAQLARSLSGIAVGDERQQDTPSVVSGTMDVAALGKDVLGLILAYLPLMRLLAMRATSRFFLDFVNGILTRRLDMRALRHVRVAVPPERPSPPSPPSRPSVHGGEEVVRYKKIFEPVESLRHCRSDVVGDSLEQQKVAQPMALEIFFVLQAVASAFQRIQIGARWLKRSQR